jgi:hypothetical protein
VRNAEFKSLKESRFNKPHVSGFFPKLDEQMKKYYSALSRIFTSNKREYNVSASTAKCSLLVSRGK